MSTTATHPPLSAAELHQLAELERIELDDGPSLTSGAASELAALRNRRDNADPANPRWEVRELPNQACLVVDVDQHARLEAAWTVRHGDVEESGS